MKLYLLLDDGGSGRERPTWIVGELAGQPYQGPPQTLGCGNGCDDGDGCGGDYEDTTIDDLTEPFSFQQLVINTSLTITYRNK